MAVKNTSINTKYHITDDGQQLSGGCPIPAPTNLVATATSSTSVSLTWAASAGATGYTIQRATNNTFTTNMIESATVGNGSTAFSSTSLVLNTTYYFQVKATDSGDSSNWLGPVTVTFATRTQNFATPGSVAFTVPAGVSSIQIQVWGARGDSADGAVGGLGGYAKGDLTVIAGKILGINVGEAASNSYGGVNGGGIGGMGYHECGVDEDGYPTYCGANGGGGGGGSDVRYNATLSIQSTALADRKIVAGGGGGGGRCYNTSGGYGGGISGGSDGTGYTSGGSQTGGNSLKDGGDSGVYYDDGGGGGGGGYYGGYAGTSGGSCSANGGGGGSGYVGGVINSQNIAGNLSMPAPGGGNETGHADNGYVRLTYVGL